MVILLNSFKENAEKLKTKVNAVVLYLPSDSPMFIYQSSSILKQNEKKIFASLILR